MDGMRLAYSALVFLEYCAAFCVLLPELTDGSAEGKERARSWIPVGGSGLLFAYNNYLCVVSAYMILAQPAILGLLFFLFKRRRTGTAVSWALGYLGIVSLAKLLFLLLVGNYERINIIEANSHYGHSFALLGVEGGIVCILLLLLLQIKRKKTDMPQIGRKLAPMLTAVGVVVFAMMLYIMPQGEQLISRQMLALNLCCMLVILSMLLMYGYKLAADTMKRESAFLRERTRQLGEQYRVILTKYEEAAKMQHDAKHRREYLLECLEEGKTEEARAALRKAGEERGKTVIWTGVRYVDFIINSRKEEMDQWEIAFVCEGELQSLPMEGEDACVILGNLLDNAIEAAKQCAEGKRRIRLKISNRNELFQLCLENTSTQRPKVKEGRFCTTKEDRFAHGWGIENVKLLVEKYQGVILFEYDDTFFRVKMQV